MDGSSERRNRICKIDLDEQLRIRRNADIEHERTVAIFDLLEENLFELSGDLQGPYHLTLSIEDSRLAFDVRSETGDPLDRTVLPLSPFRGVIKDYFTVCESYYDAIKRLSPSQIEALDMGRRAVHNEGSQLLRERLEGKITMDLNTARRLFTLICVLHIRA
jgi:uncharacterized protein (UPF0262 family)